MTIIELPERCDGLRSVVLLDWRPAKRQKPDKALLKQLRSARRSKGGVRQSEHSRKRQAFIVGMPVQRLSADEQAARRAYLAEWHWRAQSND